MPSDIEFQLEMVSFAAGIDWDQEQAETSFWSDKLNVPRQDKLKI